jgi:hypothetical protein
VPNFVHRVMSNFIDNQRQSFTTSLTQRWAGNQAEKSER